MSVLSQLEAAAPSWMVGAYRATMAPLMATVAVTLDAMKELVDQARMGWLPGQLDVPGGNGFDNYDALPLILRDRALRAGLLETPYSQADRARRWLEEWARSATPMELLNQLAAVLGPDPPELLIVNGSGVWWLRETDGTITQFTTGGTGLVYDPVSGDVGAVSTHAHTWDWDSSSLPAPPGKGDATRFWLIIRCPSNGVYLASVLGTCGDGHVCGADLNGPDEITLGTCAPQKHVELRRAVIREWRAAGFRCSHMIEAFDPASFQPNGSSGLYPDGTWGWPAKLVGSVMTPTRDLTARYGRAEPGGVAGSD